VRTVEARSRESNGEADADGAARRRRSRAQLHPDQEHAAREIAEALGGALGAEVRVKALTDGGYRAEISFATAEDAIELARRLRPRAVA
jgi:ParB family transcriptional regulator, chromosome partitioning protein